MVIKKYIVRDMNEAMMRIKYDLGKEAVIVSSKPIKQKGITGYFKKKMLEVTAAIDSNSKNSNKKVDKGNTKFETKSSTTKDIENENLIEEMKEIKKLLNNLSSNNDSKQSEAENTKVKLDEIFRDYDFNDEVKKRFLRYLKVNYIELNDVDKLKLYSFLQEEVKNVINIEPENDNKIQIYIGPTGVGKTTTIAKLAANETIKNGKKVALITLDTYRIGAVEQLKTYANILGVPLEVVLNKEELSKAIEKFDDYDKILIDSMGRSHKNHEQLKELKDYFKDIEDKYTYLVMSITTKFSDLISIKKSYDKIGYNSMILTKLDETDKCGNILNLSYHTDIPLSYICTGQNVPDDIEIAERSKLFQYIWGRD